MLLWINNLVFGIELRAHWLVIRYRGSDNTGVKELSELLAPEEDSVAPRRDSDFLLLVLVVRGAHFEFIRGRELDLSLFEFKKDIPRLLFLQQLIACAQVRQLIVFDLFNAHLKAVHVYAVIQIAAPEEDVVLE